MQALSYPSPLTHSWPLFERDHRFELGCLLPGNGPSSNELNLLSRLAARGIGRWECDLKNNNKLSWDDGVFNLFGLPVSSAITREETAALYVERSRAAMERLRAYAIKQRRGFTLDAEIVAATGARKWMRLIAAPIIERGKVTRLSGVKQDVTALYKY